MLNVLASYRIFYETFEKSIVIINYDLLEVDYVKPTNIVLIASPHRYNVGKDNYGIWVKGL